MNTDFARVQVRGRTPQWQEALKHQTSAQKLRDKAVLSVLRVAIVDLQM
jgi:hypothetical protein